MENVADIYPLTPTQEGILYHALSDADPASYFEQVTCELVGDLDVPRLRRAWAEVFARHPALRTSFVWSGAKRPLQVVRERVELPWTELDLRKDPDAERTLTDLADASRRTPFDLQRAPVTRLTIARVADQVSHFRWDFHHLLLDGWSAVLVFDEVLQRYRNLDLAFVPGPPARAHAEWSKRQDTDAAVRHWSQLLAGHEPGSDLLIGVPASGRPFTRRRHDHVMTGDLGQRANDFVRSNRLTLNTLVQGAWALTLERLLDRDDVVFGVVTSGRPPELPGIEETVGMFLATLPFRVHVGAQQPVRAWLAAIQRQQSDMLAHQHLSLASIRRAAGVDPGSELFDSVLVFENYPQPINLDDEAPGRIEVRNKHVFEQTHYPLTVMIMPGSQFRSTVLYDAARLAEDDICRIMALFETQLEALIAAPDARPIDVSRLTDVDIEHLAAWNDTTTDHAGSEHAPLQHLGRWLDSVAPRSQVTVTEHTTGQRASLSALDARACSTARAWSERGIRAGDVVGIRLERSLDLVVAAWAAWKLGAAYAPFGPATSQERIDQAVQTAGIVLVVDDPVDLAGAGPPGPMVASACPTPGKPAQLVDEDEDQVACVVFTSGSTGAPKPVEITHRALANRLRWQLGRYPVEAGETAVAKTSLDFVDHLWELWGPLVGGANVVLVDDRTARDPNQFLAAVAEYAPTRLTIVPSLLDALVDSASPQALAGSLGRLRWLTVSGETLSWSLVDKVERLLPGVVLLNFYGMSEATADVSWFEFGGSRPSSISPPIGRPIDNLTIEVLDRRGRPAPVGVLGELSVGGSGLARGYRNQPDATLAAFGPGPVHRYRTGDLGRWLPTGVLEFAGRRDRQVKIRGVRVEPDGVEAVLRMHPAVAEAVVVSVGDGTGARLAAHVRGVDQAERPTVDELKNLLRAQLAEQAVPATIAIVDALPRLPSGKVDRAALALGPMPTTREADGVSRMPTEEEAAMIALWVEVLGIDTPGSAAPIGPDDDFFALGGDSLTALRLFARIDREYATDLPLAAVFSAPTPAAMVRRLGLGSDPASSSPTVASRPVLLGSSPIPGALAPLSRRLAGVADLVEASFDAPAEPPNHEALILCAHGEGAQAALTFAIDAARNGRRPKLVLLIDAVLDREALDRLATSGPGPERLVFLEPAEEEGHPSPLPSSATRRRLAECASASGWADTTEIVLTPGTSATALSEPNVSWLAHLITDQLEIERSRHLVRISGTEQSPRTLFAVHGEFGNIVSYRDLAVSLGDEWSLVGVQASGVHGTRPLHSSIEEMAEAYLAELLVCQPTGPYLLAGYSAGGTIAYEMARRLTAAGHEVEALVWFDHYRMGALKPETARERMWRLARNRLKVVLTDGVGLRAGIERRRLNRMLSKIDLRQPDQWWMEITRLAADQADAENMRGLLISQSVQEARQRYHHGPYAGRIILYQADLVDEARSPDRGWSDAELDLVRVPVPGAHNTVLLAGNVEAIADDLRRRFPV